MTKQYIERADVAKMMKRELSSRFPGVAFTVKSKTYSGGGSINIGWTDGPTEPQVEQIVSKFESRGFDGSIDMEYIIRHYVEGGKIHSYSTGTEGSRGSVPAWGKLPEGAEEVTFNTGYVFTTRKLSPSGIQAIMSSMIERGYIRPEQWKLTEHYHEFIIDAEVMDRGYNDQLLQRVFYQTGRGMSL